MNEAETRAELIDPKLKANGWGVIEGSRIMREYHITAGRIMTGGKREKPLIADYVLVYQGRKLATIEAKSNELEVGEGVGQAKNYAEKMHLSYTYASNGKEIYQICMDTGLEGTVLSFPTPNELWNKIFTTQNNWRDLFSKIPLEDLGGTKPMRNFQEVAVNKTMEAIAEGKPRILLTMATGTGKTFVAFQIAWKLFQARWNLQHDGKRRPRILFLADRNILADQAFNEFSAFPQDALIRIKPNEISKKGKVPTNGSIFFTIFQTFMSGPDNTPYFGEYPPDFFDFIIIDECHRGGANDESTWRGILEYFNAAVQLGLTATPKRKDNVDTYRYFGEPVFIYSLKEGINDGYLTPFKVKRIQTTLDDYIYAPDDKVIEGEIEAGRLYTEPEFNKIIEINEREARRVKIFMGMINQSEKSIVFCATQNHAAAVRELINQNKKSKEPNYCVRVTANDAELGEQYLREFRDNEKTIPTILTTSQKLSTGVDARNIRNIILMRHINSIIEFKQIVGRGTRLYEGKEYFTIYDFVDAYRLFNDPEWDGEPIEPVPVEPKNSITKEAKNYDSNELEDPEKIRKVKVKLADGKEREIQHMVSTSYWSSEGKPITAEQFLQNLFGTLPVFFKNEDELRQLWSNPITRKALLEHLQEAGYGKVELGEIQRLIDAEQSDLFDVLEYISFAIKPMTRAERVAKAKPLIYLVLDKKQREFIDFVLSRYVESGVEELDQDKLPDLLQLKYYALEDAKAELGPTKTIRNIFLQFQKHLYAGTTT